MDLVKTVVLFEELRLKISKYRDYLSGNETVTRVLLVDPVLEVLGWDAKNPDIVELEFEPATTKRSKADYVLKNDDQNVAIVEAKRFNDPIPIDHLTHREQAEDYARYAGVKFFVLTDGAKWRLYERDLMTGLEDLQPIVKFDLENDDLTRCALSSLSLWRATVSLGLTSTMASEPTLVPTEPHNRPKINRKRQELTDTVSGQTDSGWKSLANLSVGSRANPPTKVRIEGKDVVLPPYNDKRPLPPYTTWTGFLVCFAKWLVASSNLDRTKCPIAIYANSDLSLIADKPVHPSGSQFHSGEEIGDGLWINKNLSTPNKLRSLIYLLENCGFDPSTVQVKID